MLRIIFRLSGYVFAVLAVLAALAVLTVESRFFKSYLKDRIIREVEAGIHGTLTIESLTGNLFTSVTLTGIRLSIDGEELGACSAVTVRYWPLALIRRTILAHQVAIEAPAVRFIQHEDGRWNYDLLAKPSGKKADKKIPPFPLSIIVHKLALRDGLFLVHPRGKPRSVEVRAVALAASGSFSAKTQTLSSTISRLSLDAVAPRLVLRELSGDIAVAGENLTFARMRIATAGSHGSFSGALHSGREAAFDAEVDLPQVSLEELQALAPGLTLPGSLSFSASVHGPLSRLEIRQRLDYRGLRMESAATADIPGSKAQVTLALRGLQPEVILPGCGLAGKGGCPAGEVNIDAVATASGRDLDTVAGDIKIILQPSRIGEYAVMPGTITATVRAKTVVLGSATIRTSGGTIAFSGKGYIGGFSRRSEPLQAAAGAELRDFDLGGILGPRWKSRLSLQATAAVRKDAGDEMQDLRASARVQIQPSEIAGISLKSSTVDISRSRNNVQLRECVLKADAAHITVSGYSSPQGIGARFDADVKDAGFLTPLLAKAVAGKARITGTVDGTFERPHVAGTVKLDTAAYGPFSASSLNLAFDGALGGLLPEGNVHLSAGGLIAGKMAFEKVTLSGTNGGETLFFSLDVIRDPLRRYAFSGKAEHVRRRLTGVSIDSFRVSAGTVAWVNSGPLQAQIAGDAVAVTSFTLVSSPGEITAAGRIGRIVRNDFTLRIASVSVGDSARMGGIDDFPLQGTLDAQARITGDYRSPRVTSGIFLSSASIGSRTRIALATSLSSEADRLALDLALWERGREVIVASGSLPAKISLDGGAGIDRSGEFSIAVKGTDIDPSLLPALTSVIESAAGKLSFDLLLTGTPAHPLINGKLALSNASLRLASTGTEYRDISLHATASDGAVSVEDLFMRSGNGTARGRGSFSLSAFDLATADAALVLGNFRAMDTSLFSGSVDADLRLQNQALTGTVKVRRATVNIPEKTQRSVQEIRVVEKGGKGERKGEKRGSPAASPFENLRINANLSIPGNTWVKGYGLNSEIEGKLNVRKEPAAAPAVAGTMRTVRGTFTFRGRLLTIQEGSFVFSGGSTIDPFLYVTASGKIADITVYVYVRGTASRPQVSLASDPPRDQSDILAYLIFGKPSSQLTETQGSVLQKTAVTVIGQAAAKGIGDVLGSSFAPDVLNIQPEGGGGVGVGKYLTSNLFVRYEWHLGVDEVTQTIIEYQMSNHFSVRSQVGNERTAGVDLLWTTDY